MDSDFAVRPPTVDDAEAIAGLQNAVHLAEIGTEITDAAEVRIHLTSPIFDASKDAAMVLDSTGSLVGFSYVDARPPFRRINLENYVRPEHMGRGVGTLLLSLSEKRAAEIAGKAQPSERVVAQHSFWNGVAGPEQFILEHGYLPVRYFQAMEISMGSERPSEPDWPEGISVRTLVRGRDERAAYEADMESFADHWGFDSLSFEEWVHEIEEDESFDPQLFFLATAKGGEVAGLAWNRNGRPEDPDAGHVDVLGVRTAYRNRGLGRALLLHTFRAFHARGTRRVILEVDAENVSGATRLYEHVGMSPYRRWTVFEKELRAATAAR